MLRCGGRGFNDERDADAVDDRLEGVKEDDEDDAGRSSGEMPVDMPVEIPVAMPACWNLWSIF